MDAAASGRVLDVDDLALFLRVQASWLCQGLSRRDDPVVVRRLLGLQDRSHESWLTLFAEVRTRGEGEAPEALAELYRCHGRIAGILAGGPQWQLDHETAAAAGKVLSEDLVRRTEAAIAALGGAGPWGVAARG